MKILIDTNVGIPLGARQPDDLEPKTEVVVDLVSAASTGGQRRGARKMAVDTLPSSVRWRKESDMSQPKSEIQAEIEALQTVLSTLAPLDEGTRRRVLAYVQQRFGVAETEAPSSPLLAPPPSVGDAVASTPQPPTVAEEIRDIRTLKEKKQPKSAVEMAVLVAYYVSEIAKSPERKTSLGTTDITKYFKQAGYRLPSRPRVILHQAKNAGYLDSGARGQYSLNPVGYNLVSHGLPRASAGKRTTSTRRPGQAKSGAKSPKKTAARARPRTQKKSTARAEPRQTRKKR